ncbi:MAG: diaminopimelate decarboxylase [Lachnospiraceae bacterium]|nr:diaminopimelate decarboxylase [Lachnospiraceae bacterium]
MKKEVLRDFVDSGKIVTPCYIFDKDELDVHVDKICNLVTDRAGNKINLCYAMKANAMITEIMSKKVRHIEVCSPGEFEICKALNIPGEKIILSGVNKTADNIKDAIEYGVDIITLESVKHYNLVKDMTKSSRTGVTVLPRLSGGAQFGMSEEEVEFVISDSKNIPEIDVIGIHFFTGTQKKNIAKDKEEIDYSISFINGLKEKYEFAPRLLEYGAGLAVPYFEGDDFDHVYDGLSEIAEYIATLNLEYEVGIELGRFFAYNSMIYLTAIDDIKRVKDTNICIVDGGIHQINYYGQNMAMRVPVIDLFKNDKQQESITGHVDYSDSDWKVCGSLCTFADILVRKVTLDKPKSGDVLAFYNTGAYSMTESPALFLSRRMPSVYSYSEQDGLSVIREALDTYTINMPLA